MTLTELHEAATSAPWIQQPMYTSHRSTAVVGMGDPTIFDKVCECGFPINKGKHPTDIADAALIVALRNAFADGTLIERAAYDELLAAATVMSRIYDCCYPDSTRNDCDKECDECDLGILRAIIERSDHE